MKRRKKPAVAHIPRLDHLHEWHEVAVVCFICLLPDINMFLWIGRNPALHYRIGNQKAATVPAKARNDISLKVCERNCHCLPVPADLWCFSISFPQNALNLVQK